MTRNDKLFDLEVNESHRLSYKLNGLKLNESHSLNQLKIVENEFITDVTNNNNDVTNTDNDTINDTDADDTDTDVASTNVTNYETADAENKDATSLGETVGHVDTTGQETDTTVETTTTETTITESETIDTDIAMALQIFILDCSSGNLEKVKETLEKKNLDVNGKDEQGTPALNYAVMLGHTEIVSLLLSHGADPTVKDAKGRDAKKWASRSANQELKKLILQNRSTRPARSSRSARSPRSPRLSRLSVSAGSFTAEKKSDSTVANTEKNSDEILDDIEKTIDATVDNIEKDSDDVDNSNNSSNQPPAIAGTTNERDNFHTSQRGSIAGTESSDAFDWTQGKPTDMIPFDPDDSAHILNVAIRTIVPSKKSKFQPLGANALFLCARYAFYHTSIELANIFLDGAVRIIRLWVHENGMSSNPSPQNPSDSGFASSFCRLYWLSNSMQLLIYLKRDGKMISGTIEPQLELSSLIQELLEGVCRDMDTQLYQLVGPALVDWNADESKLEADFFGFAKRKTLLRVPSLLDTLQNEGNRREIFSNISSFISSIPNAANTASGNATAISNHPKHPSDFFTMFTTLLAACKSGGLHESLINQISIKFCTSISNHLLTRILKQRSLCSRSRAQQIHLNLSEITDWIRQSQLVNFNNVSLLIDSFIPIFQVLQFLQVVSTCSRVSTLTSLYESFTFLSYELIHHLMAQYRFEKGEQSFPEVVELHVQSKVDHSVSSSSTSTRSHELNSSTDQETSTHRLTPAFILSNSYNGANSQGPLPEYLCDFKMPARDESMFWKGNPIVPKIVLELINQGAI